MSGLARNTPIIFPRNATPKMMNSTKGLSSIAPMSKCSPTDTKKNGITINISVFSIPSSTWWFLPRFFCRKTPKKNDSITTPIRTSSLMYTFLSMYVIPMNRPSPIMSSTIPDPIIAAPTLLFSLLTSSSTFAFVASAVMLIHIAIANDAIIEKPK